MKSSTIRFDHLRHLLLNLGFTESRPDGYWRFEHTASGAVFLFRSYTATDRVSVPDVASTRTHLEWRGLLPCHAFDDSLAKTPA